MAFDCTDLSEAELVARRNLLSAKRALRKARWFFKAASRDRDALRLQKASYQVKAAETYEENCLDMWLTLSEGLQLVGPIEVEAFKARLVKAPKMTEECTVAPEMPGEPVAVAVAA